MFPHVRRPSYDRLLPFASWNAPSSAKPSWRRVCVTAVGALIAASALVAATLFVFLASEARPHLVYGHVSEASVINSTLPTYQSVLGPPTASFTDNLRNDTQYITSWIAAGWTNDVMSYINLLYLAQLTGRVPILPPFAPTHVGSEAGFISFGTIFDVPRLSAALRTPVLEWAQVKDAASTHVDALGCWSIWATANPAEARPRENVIEAYLHLDVAYTPVPSYAKLFPQYPGDWYSSFAALAAITFPQARDALPPSAPFPARGGHAALPDEHLACFDFPYYVSALNSYEFAFDYSPAWRFVGRHVRWAPQLEALAHSYLRRTFNVSDGDPVPAYIALHIRRADFSGWCRDVPADECFAPLDAYARRVAEVRAELGAPEAPVLVTSDERDAAWWAAVRARGWARVDHAAARTAAAHGAWYPALLDAVFQSLAAGFVGTDRSTMSLVAQRRVEDWHGGVTRAVKWGWKDADAH